MLPSVMGSNLFATLKVVEELIWGMFPDLKREGKQHSALTPRP
jgi:hypothetical protein